MAVAAHHHDIFDENGEGPVDLFGLRDVGDEVFAQGFGDGFAKEADRAAGGGDEAHDRLEERGFSRAVDADERGDRAAGDHEAGVAQGGQAVAVGDGQALGEDAAGGAGGGCVGGQVAHGVIVPVS